MTRPGAATLTDAAELLWRAVPPIGSPSERTLGILQAVIDIDCRDPKRPPPGWLLDIGGRLAVAHATDILVLPRPLEVAGPARWSPLLQALLEVPAEAPARRRGLGAFFTPPELVGTLVDRTLQPLIDGALAAPDPSRALGALSVLDPTCGAGAFLRAAAVRLHAAWQHLGVADPWQRAAEALWGWDVEPAALCVCAATLRWDAGAPVQPRLLAGDFLAETPSRRWSAILGNPPFLGQLKGDTVRDRAVHAALGHTFGALLGPYTDASAIFLVHCKGLLEQGGRMALVQPLSLLGARDAGVIRDHVLRSGTLAELWLGLAVDFGGARVDVCAPILQNEARATKPRAASSFLPILSGLPPKAARVARADLEASWSPALAAALGVPQVQLSSRHTVGAVARVTADFRDQFYGIAPYVVEEGLETPRSAQRPPLVVTKHIDPLRMSWGEGPIRFAGRQVTRPLVDLVALAEAHPRLGAWARDRLTPKLVMATQSRVIEVAVDPHGAWLNTTPTLTIHAPPAELWRLAAALSSATLCAWAWRQFAGTALTATALKLSARQVQGLPLPEPGGHWEAAAELLRQADEDDLARRDPAAHGAVLAAASRQMALAWHGRVDEAVEAFWSEGRRPRRVQPSGAQ